MEPSLAYFVDSYLGLSAFGGGLVLSKDPASACPPSGYGFGALAATGIVLGAIGLAVGFGYGERNGFEIAKGEAAASRRARAKHGLPFIEGTDIF